MEKQSTFIQSVTLILSGSLLQSCGNMGEGWASAIIATGGFALFYIGLGDLATALDDTGKKAVNLMRIAALIGAVGGVIDLIPLMGLFAGIMYLAAFIIELVGLIQLKDSSSFDMEGKSGVSNLIVAMALAAVAVLLSILPAVGGFFSSLLYIGVVVLTISGWLKVQKSIINRPGTDA